MQAFLNLSLQFSRNPYVYLDATYMRSPITACLQFISRVVIVPVGITATGQREVLGF